jgi:hypothetical protein
MNNKKYTISSVADQFVPFEITVDGEGIVLDDSNNGILIGSKFESLVRYWKGFEGENGYNITEKGV